MLQTWQEDKSFFTLITWSADGPFQPGVYQVCEIKQGIFSVNQSSLQYPWMENSITFNSLPAFVLRHTLTKSNIHSFIFSLLLLTDMLLWFSIIETSTPSTKLKVLFVDQQLLSLFTQLSRVELDWVESLLKNSSLRKTCLQIDELLNNIS